MATDDPPYPESTWWSESGGPEPRSPQGPYSEPDSRGPPEPGQRFDRYVIEMFLGEGAFAKVYRVRHATLGTVHALKLLGRWGPDVRERLVREGRIQARLKHPNVVAVTDVIAHEAGLGLIMDYVSGPSLEEWLRTRRPEDPEVERLFKGIVAGVASAHALGVVHRDLKPANVLLEVEDGELVPRVTDFGLAKVLGSEGAQHTRSGARMGSPAYMSPEQIHDSSDIDQRADVFSLGCILYELLVGQRPFRGQQLPALFNAILSGQYEPLETARGPLPPRLKAAVHGALEIDREQRIGSCEALLKVMGGEDATETPTPKTPTPKAQAPTVVPFKVSPTGTLVPETPQHRVSVAPPTEAPGPASEPRPSRSALRSLPLLLLALPFLMAALYIGDGLELRLHQRTLQSLQLPAEATVLIEVPRPANPRQMRTHFPALLDAAVQAGLRSVSFDINFTPADPGDELLAQAILATESAGVPVVVAVPWVDGEAQLPQTPALAQAMKRVGIIHVETVGYRTLGPGQVPALFRSRSQQPPTWTLAVETVGSWMPNSPPPELRADQLALAGKLHPLEMERLQLRSVQRSPRLTLDPRDPSGLVQALQPYKGRAALVGMSVGSDQFVTDEGLQDGMELHAALVEILAAGAAPIRVERGPLMLLALLLPALSFGLVRVLPPRWRALGLLVPGGALALALALAVGGWMLDLLPTVGGSLLGWGLGLWRAARAQSDGAPGST